MIRNLFKRIAEFITGTSRDEDASAIPFAELSRKKAEEQAKKERAERRRRSRDKKSDERGNGEATPQREDTRKKGQGKPSRKAPARRPVGDQKPPREKAAPRSDRAAQRPAKDTPPKKETPQKNGAPKQPRKPAWSLDEFQVPEKEGEVRFHDLDLPVKLMHGIAELGFQYATPIQAGCLPETLKGRDTIGKAQTGTGKSAAFLITIINHLGKNPMRGGPEKSFPRALILAPTRELALQIEKDARDLCKFTPYKIVSLFGGTGYEKQKKGMASSVDIIVATPGRLIDFKNQKLVDLSRVEILVIDEADRMLDMGFIPDIRKIVYATPHKEQRQTLFFSATYSSDVMRLAEQWTRDPHHMEIEPETVESASVDQKIFLVTTDEKFPLLYNLIIGKKLTKVLVFTNRRDQARRLAEKLNRLQIKADLLSGEVAQNKRIRALEDFRSGKVQVLVATDVAARGLHIDEISHVINYNLPQDAEHYVHRIGRTGRAGATGTSVSFACEDDSYYIPAIEELLGHKLECEYPDDALLQDVRPPSRSQRPSKPQRPSRSEKPSSPWQDPELIDEEWEDDPVSDEAPEPESPAEEPRCDSRQSDIMPEAEPSRERDTKEHRPRKPASKKTEKAASPWYASQLSDEDEYRDEEEADELSPVEEPVVKKPAVQEPTVEVEKPVVQETPEVTASEPPAQTPEASSSAAVAAPRRPRGPRPARNTRRPTAPRNKKRPGTRYTKTPRTDK